MARSLHVDVDGPVHLIDHGGTGTPILLIHGLGGSHVNWSAVAGPLAEFGAVRAIDLIGFGRTPPHGRSAAVEAQREMVIAYLREHAHGPAILVGNSMGGLISMLVARAAPEHVRALVLVDPALPVVRPRIDPGVLRGLGVPLIPGYGPRALHNVLVGAAEHPERLIDEMLRLITADPARLHPGDRERMLAMARERASMPWAGDAFVDAARSIFRIVVRGRTFARRVASIAAPAVVVHGDRDRLVDVASARWLIRQRRGWQLAVMEGIGHVPQLEAPDRFMQIVGDWLATNSPQGAAGHLADRQ
jgi:pimeloyl-ACP methyl ester carboxylesterase